jgi:hypothetical protein
MAVATTGQCYCFVDLLSAREAENAIDVLNGTPTPYGGSYKIIIVRAQQDCKVRREQAEVLHLMERPGRSNANCMVTGSREPY